METKFKVGDLVTVRYQWSEGWKKGIGYVYEVGEFLYVGLSCKDGGCMNLDITKLRSVQLVETKPIY